MEAACLPILIAIGSNLPGPDGADPLEICRRAAIALDALPGLRLRGLSRWYRTAAVPASDQPDFVNGVAHLEGAIAPPALLAALQAIEARAGRRRGAVNEARVLDLDIVAMGQLVRVAPDPVLPHPRAHLRGFVLAPLAEVAPSWQHPLLHCSAQGLLAALVAALPEQRIGVI
jgi:2-amino-4-hydroxy-6-hydroxymethyldihydropteridine diphosphokinase